MSDLPFLFDGETVARFQELLGLGWPTPWRVVTLLGTNWGILLTVGLALWLWSRRLAYGILAVVALDGVLKMALNQVLHVSRPAAPEIVKYERVGVGSFPSGHLSTAASTWGYLAHRGPVPWAWPVVVVLLVGASRLYLGVHFVGDLLGAIVLAAVVVWAVGRFWPPLCDRLARIPFAVWVAFALVALAGVVLGSFFYFGGNPYKWRAGGLVAGLAIALPLEHRFIQYRVPERESVGRKVAKAVIGILGIVPFALVDQITGEQSDVIGLVSTLLAAVWTVLTAPTLFAMLGWAREEDPARRRLVRNVARSLGTAALVVGGVLGYGTAIEPRLLLDVREHEVTLENLPDGWRGGTVALVSDFQLGLWLDNTGMMRRSVAEIVEREPGLAMLAGDFIYHPGDDPTDEIAAVMDIVRPLTDAGIPTVAVLGNHDWGLERPVPEAQPNRAAGRELRDSLRAAGIHVLHNRARAVVDPAGGDSLWVVGIGSHWLEEDRPGEAVAQVPGSAPRVVVMHNPGSFPALSAGSAPLAVAGHTHGGQARLPLTPQWSWLSFVRANEVHVDGWIEDDYGEPGNRLYITRGIGMSLLPMRFNAAPELTLFHLR